MALPLEGDGGHEGRPAEGGSSEVAASGLEGGGIGDVRPDTRVCGGGSPG